MKLSIKNRDGKRISLILRKGKKGSVFIIHGHGGFKEQPLVSSISKAFKDFTTIRFDARNTYGESEGSHEEATVSSFIEDLEDVIIWARKKGIAKGKIVLAGHSLGAMCAALYAQSNTKDIKALVLVSPMVSGKLSLEHLAKKELKLWEKIGWKERRSKSRPGGSVRTPWTYNEDKVKYDLLKDARNIDMPVTIIVGRKDKITPLKHQKMLSKKLTKCKIFVVEDADHFFMHKNHLEELENIIKSSISIHS